MLQYGRSACGDPHVSGALEWLVTNGLGGYASGTMAGMLTRRYHGLLIAALKPPADRWLLASKLDEVARYDGREYALSADSWEIDSPDPRGFEHIESFRLEGTCPVWTFALGDALLEKIIWMQPGANTTYARYRLVRAQQPLELTVRALVNDRGHHQGTLAGREPLRVSAVEHGLRVELPESGVLLSLLSDRAEAKPGGSWASGYFLPIEERRGYDAFDRHFSAGTFEVTLRAGETVTFAASIEPQVDLDGDLAWEKRKVYEAGLLEQAEMDNEPAAARQLVLAADQFIVRRDLPGEPDGRSVIAGYPWFTDWGRDTMISLPGLTLNTCRYTDAARILRTFARFVDQGMLPNHFPAEGEQPSYNTVDAALWYVEAARAYYAATADLSLVRDLFPVLAEIIRSYQCGTRYRIHADPADGLIYAGEPGVQLTWMDVKIGDWVVTPRAGKAVEINALWYNALCSMAAFASRLGHPQEEYRDLADKVQHGFARFWKADLAYLADVIDGPDGDDVSLRPNQLLAVSLHHSPLSLEQQKAVVDICARRLLTSHGLRTLDPGDRRYHPRYNGSPRVRDEAYHQGTVWAWLIGPFVSAHWRVYRDRDQARSFLLPLLAHLEDHGLGTISEVFDGDAPHEAFACIAQAWSVAEVLRAWRETQG